MVLSLENYPDDVIEEFRVISEKILERLGQRR
jgi:hypothetical protein